MKEQARLYRNRSILQGIKQFPQPRDFHSGDGWTPCHVPAIAVSNILLPFWERLSSLPVLQVCHPNSDDDSRWAARQHPRWHLPTGHCQASQDSRDPRRRSVPEGKNPSSCFVKALMLPGAAAWGPRLMRSVFFGIDSYGEDPWK